MQVREQLAAKDKEMRVAQLEMRLMQRRLVPGAAAGTRSISIVPGTWQQVGHAQRWGSCPDSYAEPTANNCPDSSTLGRRDKAGTVAGPRDWLNNLYAVQ